MAHSPENLTVEPGSAIAGAGSGLVLHEAYLVTTDTAATVEAANYLNASAARLPKGTMISAVMDIGGATPKLKNYIVTANTGTVVTIALQTTTAG